jgi:hypothetical protein
MAYHLLELLASAIFLYPRFVLNLLVRSLVPVLWPTLPVSEEAIIDFRAFLRLKRRLSSLIIDREPSGLH